MSDHDSCHEWLNPPEDSPEFLRGVESVIMIRCVPHRAIPPYNRNEASSGECAACAVESLRAEVERLRKETR